MRLWICADRNVDNVLKVELETRGGQKEKEKERNKTSEAQKGCGWFAVFKKFNPIF